MDKCSVKVLFVLSFLIGALIVAVSAGALSSGGTYAHETPQWQIQCMGQDLVNLVLTAPCLLTGALLMLNGHLAGRLIWPGIMLYVLYTFAIYCFSVHFNPFFIAYCFIFGLSLYALAFFLYHTLIRNRSRPPLPPALAYGTAAYLLVIGLAFYALWLTDIISAIRSGSVPADVSAAGLPTNPVHVLDLSVMLPLIIIGGILLLRRQWAGVLLAPYLLTFCALMNATILVLAVMAGNDSVLTATFAAAFLIGLVLLIALVKQYYRVKPEDEGRS